MRRSWLHLPRIDLPFGLAAVREFMRNLLWIVETAVASSAISHIHFIDSSGLAARFGCVTQSNRCTSISYPRNIFKWKNVEINFTSRYSQSRSSANVYTVNPNIWFLVFAVGRNTKQLAALSKLDKLLALRRTRKQTIDANGFGRRKKRVNRNENEKMFASRGSVHGEHNVLRLLTVAKLHFDWASVGKWTVSVVMAVTLINVRCGKYCTSAAPLYAVTTNRMGRREHAKFWFDVWMQLNWPKIPDKCTVHTREWQAIYETVSRSPSHTARTHTAIYLLRNTCV